MWLRVSLMLWYMQLRFFKTTGAQEVSLLTEWAFAWGSHDQTVSVSTYKTTFSYLNFLCDYVITVFWDKRQNNWKPPDSKTGIFDMYLNTEPMRLACYSILLRYGNQTSDAILILMCNFLILSFPLVAALFFKEKTRFLKIKCSFSI